MPLALAPLGITHVICKIGGTSEIKSHLEDMGFIVGETITVLSRFHGNLIVRVKEARIAISSETARKIWVFYS